MGAQKIFGPVKVRHCPGRRAFPFSILFSSLFAVLTVPKSPQRPRPTDRSDIDMVAMSLRRLAAVSACLTAVSSAAGLGAEQPIPGGPVQTPAPDLKEAAAHVAPRAITQHPHARGLLQKRDTNTCGYVDGNSSQC